MSHVINGCETVSGNWMLYDATEDAPLLELNFHNEVRSKLSSEEKQALFLRMLAHLDEILIAKG